MGDFYRRFANPTPSPAATLSYALQKHLNDLRYERYRRLGLYEEAGVVHN